MAIELISARTAAVAVADCPDIVVRSQDFNKTLFATDLTAGDVITLYRQNLDSTFEAVIDYTGANVVLSTSTGNYIQLDVFGVYRVLKSVTAAAVAIGVSTANDF